MPTLGSVASIAFRSNHPILVEFLSGTALSYILSPTAKSATIFMVGGGGAGGAGNLNTSVATGTGGGGGGGGANALITNLPLRPGGTITYTVGTQGIGDAGSGNPAGSSSITVSGVTYICTGGAGGAVGDASSAAGGTAGVYSITGTAPLGVVIESNSGGNGSSAASPDNSVPATNAQPGINSFTYGLQNAGFAGSASSDGQVKTYSDPSPGGEIGFSGGGGAGGATTSTDNVGQSSPGVFGGGGGGGGRYVIAGVATGGKGGAAGANTGAGGGGGGGAGPYSGSTRGLGGDGGAGYIALVIYQ